MYQNRRRQPNMGVLLLLYQIFGVIGVDKIPPVTLGAIGLQIAIFLRLFKLPWYNAGDICISVYNVLRKKEYSRLIFSALEHGDDMHLYYNMISFAFKGRTLEKKFGSIKFFYILTVFTVLTNVVYIALYLFTSEREDVCAVGFSGVIFALKVLTTYYESSYTRVMGMPIVVPTKYAVWAELVLIQVLVPNASFYGHLAGILVGMAYVTGPLKFAMNTVYSIAENLLFSSTPRFVPKAEASGYRGERFTQYAPPGMSEEEQVRRAMEESMQENSRANYYESSYNQHRNSPPPPPGFIFGDFNTPNMPPPPPAGILPNLDELRARREAHF